MRLHGNSISPMEDLLGVTDPGRRGGGKAANATKQPIGALKVMCRACWRGPHRSRRVPTDTKCPASQYPSPFKAIGPKPTERNSDAHGTLRLLPLGEFDLSFTATPQLEEVAWIPQWNTTKTSRSRK